MTSQKTSAVVAESASHFSAIAYSPPANGLIAEAKAEPRVSHAGISSAVIHHSDEPKSSSKKKKKPKKAVGPIELDLPPRPLETTEEQAYWSKELRSNRPTAHILPYGLLNASFKSSLKLLRTPSCSSLTLHTPRLILRQVSESDLAAIKRIKTEPIVQRTQLYGSPHESVIRDAFLQNYVRASMPRVPAPDEQSKCRPQYFFAITLRNPADVTVADGSKLKRENRITNAEGYIANLLPKSRKILTHPSFDQTASAELTADMFYEIHPQLWGKGIMREAFAEVVRFAIEDVGCVEVKCDPLQGNEASVKLCERNGFKYTHTSRDNPYQKPQVWHKLTRRDWWDLNRAKQLMKGTYDGAVLCRWCMNPQAPSPAYRCSGCDWGIYCSRECQRADWVFEGGHQAECEKKADVKLI